MTDNNQCAHGVTYKGLGWGYHGCKECEAFIREFKAAQAAGHAKGGGK
jgi:hypothetical protein